MNKTTSFLLVVFFLFIMLLILSAIFAIPQSRRKVEKGDLFLDQGKFIEAKGSYESAQKLWPLLYRDFALNRKIKYAEQAAEAIENYPAIHIFFKQNTPNLEIQSIVQEINEIGGVKTVKLISEEEAYRIFLEKNKDDKKLIEISTPDIFPASIEIYLNDISAKAKIQQLIKDRKFIDRTLTLPY